MSAITDSNLLLIGTMISVVSGVAFIGFAWGMIRAKVDGFRAELSKLWSWKDEHMKEAEEKRQLFEQEINAIKIWNATESAQNKEILRRLTNIETLLREEIQNNGRRNDQSK